MPHRFFAGNRRRQLTEDRPEELRKEIERRLAEIDTGSVQMIPGDEFIRALHAAANALSKPRP